MHLRKVSIVIDASVGGHGRRLTTCIARTGVRSARPTRCAVQPHCAPHQCAVFCGLRVMAYARSAGSTDAMARAVGRWLRRVTTTQQRPLDARHHMRSARGRAPAPLARALAGPHRTCQIGKEVALCGLEPPNRHAGCRMHTNEGRFVPESNFLHRPPLRGPLQSAAPTLHVRDVEIGCEASGVIGRRPGSPMCCRCHVCRQK